MNITNTFLLKAILVAIATLGGTAIALMRQTDQHVVDLSRQQYVLMQRQNADAQMMQHAARRRADFLSDTKRVKAFIP